MLDTVRIKEKLEKLASRDPKYKVFGAYAHKYVLFPRLSERTVSAFERKWRVTLPADYRQFLTELGNGGAGPSYGVFKLGEEGDSAAHSKPFRGGAFVRDPSKPFVHAKAWNLSRSVWKRKPETEGMTTAQEDRAWAAWDKKRTEDYWRGGVMNGALPICHLGCALRQWLVVSGRRAGEVWNDNRADDQGISPVKQGKRHIGFAEWYEGWLDASLRRRL